MRISITCVQCASEAGAKELVVYSVPVRDDGLYSLECHKLHSTVGCLQEMKFEILYELAVNAIVDQYYREAVVSFTSCLERFYEFYVRVSCHANGVEQQLVEKSWKSVAAQSERQYGAFLYTYLADNKSLPPGLSQKESAFRNAVVHKGKMPTHKEAVDFGNSVLRIVAPILNELKAKCDDSVVHVLGNHVKQTRERVQSKQTVYFMSMPTTISIGRDVSEPQETLEEAITRISKKRTKGG